MTAAVEQTCELLFVGDDDPDERCDEPAAFLVTSGCVHEHIQTESTCVLCLEDMRAGEVWCEKCEPLEGEACKVAPLEVKPLESAA